MTKKFPPKVSSSPDLQIHTLKTEIAVLKKSLENSQAQIFQLQSIIDHLPGNIYWKDIEGVYLGRNQYAAERMKAHAFENSTHKDSIIGLTDHDIFDKKTADMFRKHDIEVMHSKTERVVEESTMLPDGHILHQYSSKKPLLDSQGRLIGIVGNTVDISHLKKIEFDLKHAKDKAETADKIKTEFIRNMEHDIRTPLSGIWGLSNHLAQLESDSEKKELLCDITDATKELLDYCNSILDFSRIELGILSLVDKPFDPKAILRSIYNVEVPAAKHKKLKLSLHGLKKLPSKLIGDPYRIGRILINLVSNAIKFTPQGEVRIIADYQVLPERGHINLILKIQDTGIGIPPDKIEYIYEKFTRLFPYTNKAHKGTGLGLVIVKRFIHELKGRISVESQLGLGSSFICEIPLRLDPQNDSLTVAELKN